MTAWMKLSLEVGEDPRQWDFETECGMEGVGVYTRFLQLSSKFENCIVPREKIKTLATRMTIDSARVTKILNHAITFGLLIESEKGIYSPDVVEGVEAYEAKKKSNLERKQRERERKKESESDNVTVPVTRDISISNSRSLDLKKNSASPKISIEELALEDAPPEFFEPLKAFLDYRRKLKKPYKTLEGLQRFISEAEKMGIQRFKAAVTHTMAREWLGLREPERTDQPKLIIHQQAQEAPRPQPPPLKALPPKHERTAAEREQDRRLLAEKFPQLAVKGVV